MAGGDAGSSQLILAVVTELSLRLGLVGTISRSTSVVILGLGFLQCAGWLFRKARQSYMALSDINLDVLSSFLPHYIGYKQITEANSDSEEGNRLSFDGRVTESQ